MRRVERGEGVFRSIRLFGRGKDRESLWNEMPLSGYKDESCVSFRQGNWSGKIAATSGRGNIFAQRAESSRTRDRSSLLVVAESLS